MTKKRRMLFQLLGTIALVFCLNAVSGAALSVNANKVGVQTAATKIRLLFAGRANNATIFPFAHRKDLYLIVIKNVRDIVAFSESPEQFASKITLSMLSEELWQNQGLNACIIGIFSMDKDKGTKHKSYTFELSNPSYNKKTSTFSVHAQSFGGNNLPAFSSKKPVTITEISFFIDPVVGMYWPHV